MNVLALSSSRVANGDFLEPAIPHIQEMLGAQELTIAFVPFASVDRDYEEYGERVLNALSQFSYKIVVVNEGNAVSALAHADVIMVGGGNTFKLLHDLYQLKLIELIQTKVKEGTPYIGWSAGANITGRSIGTTNDMPIIQPESFRALHFLPFQLNPHYLNQIFPGFHGETRDQRLQEFVKLNPQIPVVGLPEGTALRLQSGRLSYLGGTPGVLFQNIEGNVTRSELEPNQNLSFLL